MNNLILLLGGNIGDVVSVFQDVKKDISTQIGVIEKESCIYLSPPWGFNSENQFLNQGCKIITHSGIDEVLKITQSIETYYGKKNDKQTGYKDRFIDIDIIFFNQEIINKKNIIVPHVHMHKRAFVLVPLCDIIPNYIHPILKTSVIGLQKKVNKKNISKYVI